MFYNCKNLASIVIPESVTLIEGLAFNQCERLDELYCKAKVPPTMEGNPFSSLNNVVYLKKIYVPKDSEMLYKTAAWWKDKADIIEGYNFE